jgi:glycosyltransferase involved in cell wall biosynthesis
MKRVLIFSLNYFPFVGGAEVAIKEITDRISPEEIEFHMVTSRVDSTLPKVERVGNVLVHRIGFSTRRPDMADLKKFPLHLNKFYFQIAAFIKAWSLQQKYSYDATWGMMAHSAGIPAGLFKKTFPRVSYLLTLQEGDPPEHIERMMRPVWKLFRQGFVRADVVQAISTFLKEWALKMEFKGEAVVVPNGVDVGRFARDYSADEIASERSRLGKKDDDVFLVTTSRLVHKNGVDDVIRALALLPERVSFLIYGVGPDMSALRALAKQLGVEDRARFMGQISHADMPLMLQACDIFIRPSRSEGMGISFIEAMAARLPVIATQEGGIGDFLFDAKRNPEQPATGWAVDANAPQQIASAVEDIMAHPETVARVIETAAKMVAEKYEWNQVAKSMQGIFEKLFALKPGMKVVLATPLYPPDSGGPATYAKLLVENFAGERDEVALVKFSDVRHLPKGVSHAVYFWNVLRASRNADVILALDPVSVGVPAALAAGILRKPLVVKIVGDFAWEQGTQRFGITVPLDAFVRQERVPFAVACMRVAQKFVADRATRIIVPSNYLKRIVTAWGIPSEKISVIYNSVEIPEDFFEITARETKGNTDINDGIKNSIVSAGRLVPWKGMDGVIDAVASLRAASTSSRSHLDFNQGETLMPTLVIVGDGPEREALVQKGAELLGSSIFFTGQISHENTLRTIQDSRIFVLNSTYEGLSHLLIEALALGSVIVASEAGGNPEVIQNEVNGLLVPVGDTAALAGAIERVLAEPELAARLRAAAKASAGRFTVPAMIKETRELLMTIHRGLTLI